MANQSEIVERREDVMTRLLRGQATSIILKATMGDYGVARVTVERDITHCYGEIRKKYERDLPEVISTHIGKYEEIYKQAFEMYDFRSAIASLQAIEKLLKLHVEQPLIMLQQNNLKLDNMTLDELQGLLSQSNTA